MIVMMWLAILAALLGPLLLFLGIASIAAGKGFDRPKFTAVGIALLILGALLIVVSLPMYSSG